MVKVGTYDGEDERVGEVPVEGELHHVPPQPQQLHGLGQTPKDVSTRSRNSKNTQGMPEFPSRQDQRQKSHLLRASAGPAGGDCWPGGAAAKTSTSTGY